MIASSTASHNSLFKRSNQISDFRRHEILPDLFIPDIGTRRDLRRQYFAVVRLCPAIFQHIAQDMAQDMGHSRLFAHVYSSRLFAALK
jgi:hypothetical protein